MFFATLLAINQPTNNILVFSKTAGFRHDSIQTGIETIQQLGKESHFTISATEDTNAFTSKNLKTYKAVIFLNTTGNILEEPQEKALETYIKQGGGFIGIHAAADTEYEWPFYGQLVGAWFKSHPAIQQATVTIINSKHPSTRSLPTKWSRTDEWYDYKALPPSTATILAKLDTTTYQNHTMGENHPIVWCQTIEKGRSWYTGMGHTKETYAEPEFRQHLTGGILWAAKIKN
ncbi:MAG: ThuA domain-containing protein [Fimbriimonadaceae bacterium]